MSSNASVQCAFDTRPKIATIIFPDSVIKVNLCVECFKQALNTFGLGLAEDVLKRVEQYKQ